MRSVDVKILASRHPVTYQSAHASGADIRADLKEPLSVAPGETVLVPTGIFVEIPPGYEI